MKHIILIYFLLLTDYVYGQQNIFEIKKQKLELSLKLDGTKRKSFKYFDNDTSDYSNYHRDPVFEFKNNFLAGNIGLKKYLKRNYILTSEFRFKLWGFKEWFQTPYIGSNAGTFGFSVTVINFDFSISAMKRIRLYKRFEMRPKIGATAFYPSFFMRGDSTDYSDINVIASTTYYEGKALKFGYNLGTEFNYKLSNRFAITFSSIYYSPFNNTYNWKHGNRFTATHYPWRKWAKKNDGLYFGLGIDFSLRRNYRSN